MKKLWSSLQTRTRRFVLSLSAVALVLSGVGAVGVASVRADSGCRNTLPSGFQPGRFIFDAGGCSHQNGSDAYDGMDKAQSFVRATYDFSVHGGAAGTIALGVSGGAAESIVLPNNTVIVDGLLDTVTSFTAAGSGATGTRLQISSEATGDLIDITASGVSGRKPLTPTSPATSVKTTAARTLNLVVTGNALTAGKVVLFLRYFVSG